MFNVGIVASGRSGPLVKLTDRELPNQIDGGDVFRDIELSAFGVLSYNVLIGPVQRVAGQWFVNRATSQPPENSYQVRVTLESGSDPQVYYSQGDGGLGNWLTLNPGAITVRWINSTGRVLLEIRDASTLTVLTSARFYTQGHVPPA